MNGRIIVFLVFLIILAQCACQKKVQYFFPSTLASLNQDSLLNLCEKGKILYRAHCTGCHGIFAKGKDGVPNFTKQQIDMYAAKAKLRDTSNHAVLMNMPFDQLDAIQLFLIYRKQD